MVGYTRYMCESESLGLNQLSGTQTLGKRQCELTKSHPEAADTHLVHAWKMPAIWLAYTSASPVSPASTVPCTAGTISAERVMIVRDTKSSLQDDHACTE
jgi:hypothetical protein